MKEDILTSHAEEKENQRIEGTRLFLLTPTDTEHLTQDVFNEYFMMFKRIHVFTLSMSLFANQNHGPDWCMREFHAFAIEQQVKVVEIWRSFLTLKLLSTRFVTTKDDLGLVG